MDKWNFSLSVLHAFLFLAALFCTIGWYGTNVYLTLFLFFVSLGNLVLSERYMVTALRSEGD